MKLYDYLQLCEDDVEITVWDKDYDCGEYYFSASSSSNDLWKK